jgi:hypothetical protein
MNVKMLPSSLKQPVNLNPANQQTYKKYNLDQFSELQETSITVREHEEFLINCVVENSKPVADIRFSLVASADANGQQTSQLLTLNSNDHASYLTLPPFTTTVRGGGSGSSSIISINTNVVKNVDQTYKTILTARVRPGQEDHGKMLVCKAENGFSSQKWENKKTLNVLCKY